MRALLAVAWATFCRSGRATLRDELFLAIPPTLIFVPTTYGDTVEPGDTVVWANDTYTVRDVEPASPDGVTILARVIIEI